ncbi:hypothetical protein C2G38_2074429, partial [Gigaspora rosea]
MGGEAPAHVQFLVFFFTVSLLRPENSGFTILRYLGFEVPYAVKFAPVYNNIDSADLQISRTRDEFCEIIIDYTETIYWPKLYIIKKLHFYYRQF